IRPLSTPPAKQELKERLIGEGSYILAAVLSGFLALLTIGGLVNALFPKSLLSPLLELFSLLLAPVYCIYILVAEIIEWRKRKSLIHTDYIKKRQHDFTNIQDLLATVQDKILLENTLIELKREIEESKSTSFTFIDAIKDLPPLLLAVIAIIAISSKLKSEDVSLYPQALLIGSLAVIGAYIMRFPVYRRIKLYNYWAYIVERAISHKEGDITVNSA
ncbi:MAG: hypothetical protein M3362_16750, partial [Acidobacteriota bacterium]|nr:hypothetical protein [Acidobacteriota bacterium]